MKICSRLKKVKKCYVMCDVHFFDGCDVRRQVDVVVVRVDLQSQIGRSPESGQTSVHACNWKKTRMVR